MKKRELVSTIMSKDLITVNQSNGLEDVKKIFDEHKIRHLPVVSGKKIIGLISKTDITRVTYNVGQKEVQDQVNTGIFHTFTIDDVMTKNVIAVSPDATIHEVAQILSENEFHALVVEKEGEVKGIVTTTDIIKYLLEQY